MLFIMVLHEKGMIPKETCLFCHKSVPVLIHFQIISIFGFGQPPSQP